MKKVFRNGLAAVAIVGGMATAFAFTPKNEVSKQATTGEFYLLPSGLPGDQVIGENECKPTGLLCSQEYNINSTTGQPTTPTGNTSLYHYGVRK